MCSHALVNLVDCWFHFKKEHGKKRHLRYHLHDKIINAMTTGKDHVKSTCWNVLTEAKIEPPIQTDFSLRRHQCHIFILLGARAVISLLILYIVIEKHSHMYKLFQ